MNPQCGTRHPATPFDNPRLGYQTMSLSVKPPRTPVNEITTVTDSVDEGDVTNLLYSWDIIVRNISTHDRTFEVDIPVRLRIMLHRLDESNYLRILACTTCLLLVDVIEVGAPRDRFTEVNSWFSDSAFNVVFSTHALNIDLKV